MKTKTTGNGDLSDDEEGESVVLMDFARHFTQKIGRTRCFVILLN